MTRAEFDRALTAAERAPLATARRTLHELARWSTEPWVDEVLDRRMKGLAEQCEESLPTRVFRSLGVGESWLLLASTRGASVGTVARMKPATGSARGVALDSEETNAALQGLALAAASRNRFVPKEVLSTRFSLIDRGRVHEVQGGSLGLSTCVALVSAMTYTAPRSNVAGTARIAPQTGDLLEVGFLDAKLRALRDEWPEVDTVVVARDQAIPTELGRHRILAVSKLEEALAHFGLELEALPNVPTEDWIARAHGLASVDAETRDLDEWAKEAAAAEAIAAALDAEEPDHASHARVWAALFASHAGRNLEAERLLKEATRDPFERPIHRCMRAIVAASVRIDTDPQKAQSLGREAVCVARSLPPQEQRDWLGKALGTYGRALMHAGAFDQAEPLLREAYQHHLHHAKGRREAGRSAAYLSCCLRMAGKHREALGLAEEALALASDTSSSSKSGRATLPYATLEKARAQIELGSLVEALDLLQTPFFRQGSPRAYPRLGAHRTLAKVLRAQGRHAESDDHLRTSWEVAQDRSAGETARKLGAVAAAESLAEPDHSARFGLISETEFRSVWSELFGSRSIASVLATWVY